MADENMREDLGEDEIEQDQYLVFTVRYQEFGIQAMRVQEISPVLGVTNVPNAPSYVEGILNLRGRLVSVINFRNKFGYEHKAHDEDTRVIMVEHYGFPIGVIVDSVEEVIKIPNEKVQQLPETTVTLVSGYITGVGMLDSRLIMLLDADKLLNKEEWVEAGALDEAIGKIQMQETKEK